MIAPADAVLIQEGSETRRRWIDSVISQFDREYLSQLMAYNKALNQRNTLLRYFAENRRWDAEALEPWDAQLVPLAVAIRAKRAEFVESFVPGFLETYREITNGAETVSVRYLTEVATTEEEVHQQWNEAQNDDCRLRRQHVAFTRMIWRLTWVNIRSRSSVHRASRSVLHRLAPFAAGVHRTGDGRQAHPVAGRHFRQNRRQACAGACVGDGWRVWSGVH